MPASPAASDRAWTIVALLLLAAATARGLAGFPAHLDLHPADAVGYMRNGAQLFEGRFAPGLLAWAPISSALFGLLDAVGVPALAQQDTAAVLASVLDVLALFWLLRGWLGRAPAVLLAGLWATTRLVLQREGVTLPPPTYLIGAALAFATAAAAQRGRHALGLLLAVCAAFERGEVASMLLLGGVAFAWFGRRRRRARVAWLYAVVGLAMLVFQQLHRPCADRGWYAFRQHYTGALAARGAAVEGSSFTLPDVTIARDFGDASSPLGAVLANPGAIATHAWHNLLDWPRMFASIVRPFDNAPAWSWGAIGALAAASLFAAAFRRRRCARLLRRRGPWLAAASAAALATLLWSLLLFPRSGLQLYAVPLVALVVGVALRALLGDGPRARWAALLVVAVAAAAWPRPYAHDAPDRLASRAAARMLARHAWADGQRACMLHANQMIRFAGLHSPLRPVPLNGLRSGHSTPQQVGEAFAASGANLVLIAPTDFAKIGDAAPFLLAELGSDRWLVLDYVAPTLLYARADLQLPARTLPPPPSNVGDLLPALLRSLADPDAAGVERTIHALGELGPAAQGAVAALLDVPVDGLPLRRAAVCIALGKLGVDDEPVLRRLRADAADGAAIVRQCARGALRILGVAQK